MKRAFIPGKVLSRRFFGEVIKAIVESSFPGLKYSAGLLDYGSDVLGYDDELSTDHQWGPRLSLFLTPDYLNRFGPELDRVLSEALPHEFLGYSTNFSGTKADYIRRMEFRETGGVFHIIRIHSPDEFFLQHLGIDYRVSPANRDWLRFPQQRLLTIRKGELFEDHLGIGEVKKRLEYYPDAVWFYLMSVEWRKISAEEAFVGRCGERGDELGSRIVAARIVEHLMRLSFLQNRQYFPYSKWFGTAFDELEDSPGLKAILEKVLRANDAKQREEWMCHAYRSVADSHNRMKVTPWLEASISDYYGRPFKVLFADRFADALMNLVDDDALVRAGGLGGIDQVTDHSSLLQNIDLINDRIKVT